MAKKKRRITHQSAKAKGRKLQQLVANKISEVLDIPAGKDKDIESRPGCQNGVDIILHGKAKEWFNWNVECKDHNSLNLKTSIAQAKANSEEDRPWLLVVKRSHRKKDERIEPVVIMDLNDWFEMFRELHELRLFYEKWEKEENEC